MLFPPRLVSWKLLREPWSPLHVKATPRRQLFIFLRPGLFLSLDVLLLTFPQSSFVPCSSSEMSLQQFLAHPTVIPSFLRCALTISTILPFLIPRNKSCLLVVQFSLILNFPYLPYKWGKS